MKSSGTVDAGGTKVLLRHRKDKIVLSKCYERKILVYVVVVMFNTWKCLAANVKRGYSQVGNELLHEAGSSWMVYYKRHRRIYQLVFFNFSALLLICSILEFETLTC